tara:strand:- start:7381 stop:7596 length:216 start_codon:yes stop_codon:yes gene_type:complete
MKITRTILLSIVIVFFTNITFADSSVNCDEVKSTSIVGLYDKWKCKKGQPREKGKVGNIFKKIGSKLKKSN